MRITKNPTPNELAEKRREVRKLGGNGRDFCDQQPEKPGECGLVLSPIRELNVSTMSRSLRG